MRQLVWQELLSSSWHLPNSSMGCRAEEEGAGMCSGERACGAHLEAEEEQDALEGCHDGEPGAVHVQATDVHRHNQNLQHRAAPCEQYDQVHDQDLSHHDLDMQHHDLTCKTSVLVSKTFQALSQPQP